MDLTKLPDDLPLPEDDGACNHLTNFTIPPISLPNQDGNLLRLNRLDTFRIVLYSYPMTGRPDRSLPPNWDSIPGVRGCTPQTCNFRDNYDEIVSLNAIPIGISTHLFPINESCCHVHKGPTNCNNSPPKSFIEEYPTEKYNGEN